jgi:hypothetical protein
MMGGRARARGEELNDAHIKEKKREDNNGSMGACPPSAHRSLPYLSQIIELLTPLYRRHASGTPPPPFFFPLNSAILQSGSRFSRHRTTLLAISRAVDGGSGRSNVPSQSHHLIRLAIPLVILIQYRRCDVFDWRSPCLLRTSSSEEQRTSASCCTSVDLASSEPHITEYSPPPPNSTFPAPPHFLWPPTQEPPANSLSPPLMDAPPPPYP